jgi:hypothetical protein
VAIVAVQRLFSRRTHGAAAAASEASRGRLEPEGRRIRQASEMVRLGAHAVQTTRRHDPDLTEASDVAPAALSTVPSRRHQPAGDQTASP